jgi:hypothetical protein
MLIRVLRALGSGARDHESTIILGTVASQTFEGRSVILSTEVNQIQIWRCDTVVSIFELSNSIRIECRA